MARLTANLTRDFPEVTQEDWDTVQIHLADFENEKFGGVAQNLKVFRQSFAVRSLDKILSSAQPKVQIPASFKDMDKWSQGKDIVVLVNLKARFDSTRIPFFLEGLDYNPSLVLGHELHHAVGHIYVNQFYKGREHSLIRYAGDLLTFGSIKLGTTAAAAAGLIEGVVGVGLNNAPMMISGVSVFGGSALALAGWETYALRKGVFSSEKNDLLQGPEQPYGEGEACANAYVAATHQSWQGIIA